MTTGTLTLDTMELFNNSFKYHVGQQLRHRGDTKSFSADMGLLVVARVLIERAGDDNTVIYQREYHCRMIRYSGSGDIHAFREHELMTIEEYNIKKVEDDEEMELMRNESKQVLKEVYGMFGVDKNTHVYLVSEKNNPSRRKYRPCGMSFHDGKAPVLKLTSVINGSDERINADVTNKEEIEIITATPT